jgi:dTDP-4-dehydrorhamnose reductase
MLQNAKIAITGAGGLVGKEFVRQLSSHNRLLALKHEDLDITNRPEIERILFAERPSIIINCAVLGVDQSESHPESAWAINATGAEALAQTANRINANFLQLSTNYVFSDRPRDSFLTIDDAPAPINVYGETKLAGENASKNANDKCYIVRTSWVFGLDKENFFSAAPLALKAGRKIRAITDVHASVTYVSDLVSRTIDILSRGRYSTYHVVNDGVCSYFDFAIEAGRILNISGRQLSELIEKVELDQFGLPATRPRYTPMRCKVSEALGLPPMRHWRDALAAYLASIC